MTLRHPMALGRPQLFNPPAAAVLEDILLHPTALEDDYARAVVRVDRREAAQLAHPAHEPTIDELLDHLTVRRAAARERDLAEADDRERWQLAEDARNEFWAAVRRAVDDEIWRRFWENQRARMQRGELKRARP